MAFIKFRNALLTARQISDPAFLMAQEGPFEVRYAPFDYVNPMAKVVILGITPGASQANAALHAARMALGRGASDDEALRVAKSAASFAGAMRSNLVAILDHIGVNRVIGIESCATLWTSHVDLVQFASALRYPVFVDGKNYSGSPSIRTSPLLTNLLMSETGQELQIIPNSVVIPLGPTAAEACQILCERGLISRDRVIEGLPHPSGANAERIAYFLGRKPREALSQKTDPKRIDMARALATAAVSNWSSRGASPASS